VGTYKECPCGQANYSRDDTCVRCGRSIRTTPVKDGRTVALVRKALTNANLTAEQVDYVLMAGGATGVPIVQQAMVEMFGAAKVVRTIHPKHSVALGAALLAAMIGPQIICQAPDPADPHRECGHPNESGAEACAKCGVALRPQTGDSPANPEIDLVLPSGGIAAFDYGTQTAGDEFNVFVRKGDPYPTADPKPQTYFTRAPNQRMVSIPVFGGDDATKASNNDKQGEAFAILPPGLPKDTPVRIRLWLDADQKFHVSADLEDGTDLRPWLLRGDADAKAIEILLDIEQHMAANTHLLSAVEKRDLEHDRDTVLNDLRQQRYERALENARALQQKLSSLVQKTGGPSRRAALENAVMSVEFVLVQYGWLIDPNQAYRLTNLVEDAKVMLRGADEETMQQKLDEIEKEWAALHPDVLNCMWLRQEIGLLQTLEPVLASDLLRELEQLEAEYKMGRPSAERFTRFVEKVLSASANAKGGRQTCPNGHETPKGKRYCPTCGADQLQLQVRPSSATSGTLHRL
jgi:molecular chaperone DnaK (HSP70)